MEELLLSGLLTCNKLNIIDHQHVCRAVLLLELHCGVGGDGVYQLVNKGLALFVNYFKVGILLLHMVHYRIEKVGLTKSRMTVEEEGIAIGNVVCNGVANSLCKLIGFTLDEVVEGIFIKKGALFVGGIEYLLNSLFLALALLDRLLLKVPFHILCRSYGGEGGVLVERAYFYFNCKADNLGQCFLDKRYVSGGENLLS